VRGFPVSVIASGAGSCRVGEVRGWLPDNLECSSGPRLSWRSRALRTMTSAVVAMLRSSSRSLVTLKSPIEFVDLLLQVCDALEGALQPLVRSDDADVIPHRAADLIPVV